MTPEEHRRAAEDTLERAWFVYQHPGEFPNNVVRAGVMAQLAAAHAALAAAPPSPSVPGSTEGAGDGR
jgi:hypothetical protein